MEDTEADLFSLARKGDTVNSRSYYLDNFVTFCNGKSTELKIDTPPVIYCIRMYDHPLLLSICAYKEILSATNSEYMKFLMYMAGFRNLMDILVPNSFLNTSERDQIRYSEYVNGRGIDAFRKHLVKRDCLTIPPVYVDAIAKDLGVSQMDIVRFVYNMPTKSIPEPMCDLLINVSYRNRPPCRHYYTLLDYLDGFIDTPLSMDYILGKGLYGCVYKSGKFAVKRLKNARDNILHEAVIGLILNKLECDNFMRTIGVCDGHLVMEYLDGITYANLTEEEKVEYTLQIAGALDIAKKTFNFCHYDIQDCNVIVIRHEPVEKKYRKFSIVSSITPVICDFGTSYIEYEGVHIGAATNPRDQFFDSCSAPFRDIRGLLWHDRKAFRAILGVSNHECDSMNRCNMYTKEMIEATHEKVIDHFLTRLKK